MLGGVGDKVRVRGVGLGHEREVAPEEGLDAIPLASEGGEGVLDRGDQIGELREVAVVGGRALGSAPEELVRVVVRRVAGQADDVQAVAMLRAGAVLIVVEHPVYFRIPPYVSSSARPKMVGTTCLLISLPSLAENSKTSNVPRVAGRVFHRVSSTLASGNSGRSGEGRQCLCLPGHPSDRTSERRLSRSRGGDRQVREMALGSAIRSSAYLVRAAWGSDPPPTTRRSYRKLEK